MDLEESEHDRGPSRARLGCALVIGANVALGLMVLGVFWLIGSSLDQTRSGVINQDGQLLVVSAVCPGEVLEAVRLFRVGSGDTPVEEGAPGGEELLWEVEGSGPFPARFVIGEPLEGLDTIIALTETLRDNDELIFRLRSNQLQRVDAFGFVPGQLAPGEVASVDAFNGNTEARFIDTAYEATPCP